MVRGFKNDSSNSDAKEERDMERWTVSEERQAMNWERQSDVNSTGERWRLWYPSSVFQHGNTYRTAS